MPGYGNLRRDRDIDALERALRAEEAVSFLSRALRWVDPDAPEIDMAQRLLIDGDFRRVPSVVAQGRAAKARLGDRIVTANAHIRTIVREEIAAAFGGEDETTAL